MMIGGDEWARRFGGLERLVGSPGAARVRSARVAVVGVGGVGSWTAEALARSGVGGIALVDLDEVCVSNVNRQLHAVEGTVGRSKVDVMAERVRAIHPTCEIEAVATFLSQANALELIGRGFDAVVDAIDRGKLKAHLVATCRELGVPVVVSGGAGGRRDPTKLRVADLARTHGDPLLHQVRRTLRSRYGFPKGPKRKFGVDCVFSEEAPVFPRSDGTVCTSREPGSDPSLNCESGLGTASFVTGAFGLVAAARVVEILAGPAG